MAKPKTSLLCPVQAACDGLELRNGLQMCGKCQAALARRKKVIKPRGVYYIQAEIARGKMH